MAWEVISLSATPLLLLTATLLPTKPAHGANDAVAFVCTLDALNSGPAGREAHTARRVLPDHVELAVVQVAVCRYRLVRRALCVEILGARVVAPLPTVQDQLSVPKVGRLS